MIVLDKKSFSVVYRELYHRMKFAPEVDQRRWQGVDVSQDPSSRSYELQSISISVPLQGIEDLDHWGMDIRPNLPWADDHFAERVGGEPLNPGVEWANWPWGKSANRFRDKDEVFNHTYMERLWPKFARTTPGGKGPFSGKPYKGIAWEYGDLRSLVDLLIRDPYTRQAWIPLFFPEDTGWGDGGRKPCTLGYQFLRRDQRLHIWYPLRSCDLIRHFRDDCYLAVRLLLWVLEECRKVDPHSWKEVSPGDYTMNITSLHVFENDRIKMQ